MYFIMNFKKYKIHVSNVFYLQINVFNIYEKYPIYRIVSINKQPAEPSLGLCTANKNRDVCSHLADQSIEPGLPNWAQQRGR